MNTVTQNRLAEAISMLDEAQCLNANGQHGAAMKLSYEASEFIAAAYLSSAVGENLAPSDATYERFAKTIRQPSRHPALIAEIRGLVGDVYALREIYEPALLDETAVKDVQQMIDCVTSLAELIGEIVRLR
jgi:hypothetical protein